MATRKLRRTPETDVPADEGASDRHRDICEVTLLSNMRALRERLTLPGWGLRDRGIRVHRDDARAMVHLIADFEVEMITLIKAMRVQKDGVPAGKIDDPQQDLTNVRRLF